MQSSEPAEVKFMFKNYLLHGVNCFRNINAEVTFFSYSEFIYDLQCHETILTERLEGKDEIAFSYTHKKKTNKNKQQKCATSLKAAFQLVQKTVRERKKNADITFKATIHKQERKKKLEEERFQLLQSSSNKALKLVR